MGWLIQIIVNAVSLLIIANFFDGVSISGFGAAILASFILALVNVIVKPLLVLLTLPVTVLTLGLFMFVINGITLMITSFLMGSSFVIDGIGAGILTAIVLAILSSLIHSFIVKPIRR